MLAILLRRRGIDCVVLEKFSREQVLQRMRAGILESRTVTLLDKLGLSERLHAEGHRHDGSEFRNGDERFYINYSDLYDGTPQFVYPQQEVVAALIDAYPREGGTIHFGPRAVEIRNIDTTPTVVTDTGLVITADFLAGCDGQHGVTLASM